MCRNAASLVYAVLNTGLLILGLPRPWKSGLLPERVGYMHRYFQLSIGKRLNNNNNIYIYARPMFMVLSSWQSHYESSHGSFGECRLSAEVAANPQIQPTDLGCESVSRLLYHPHHPRHLLLLLSPKADTHFIVPRRVEGWVDLGTALRAYPRFKKWGRIMASVPFPTGRGMGMGLCPLLGFVFDF